MADSIITYITYAAFLSGWAAAVRYDVQMFQQNSYRAGRFITWLKAGHFLGHRRWIFALLLAACGLLLAGVGPLWIAVPAALVSVFCCIAEFRTSYRISIVYTARVIRLLVTDVILTAALVFGLTRLVPPVVAAMLAVLLSKPMVLLSDLVDAPVNKAVTRWYCNDARRLLESHKGLVVIGVTGSYGKTSTKNYLYRILSEKYNTLVTPGNFNTTLGVVRTIREQLKPQHQVFIVEMGAKQVGDIKEICDLVHPSYGIVTAVGDMHLETFGCRANIQKTKFELIRALPSDGFGAINQQSRGIASYSEVPAHCAVVRYGLDAEGADVLVSNLHYTPSGTDFDLDFGEGEPLRLHTSLLGEGNVLDILGAVLVARRLGVSDRQIKMAVAKLQQVEHRLSISSRGGLTILDDAYNSNPEGAAMAMKVLSGMAVAPGAKKIVVTPGFVEMGSKQAEAARMLGTAIAPAADVLIIVNLLNRDAIREGALAAGMPGSAIYCEDNFAGAVRRLAALTAPGDVVLYENDLPDMFK